VNAHDVNYIVEQNRDHQLKSLIALETKVPKEKLKSLLYYGGFPLSAGQVVEGLLSAMGKSDGGAARGLGGMSQALSGAEG
jgi:2-oxoglutarate ferredoxin oxidoreductase subunit alpha